LKGAGKHVLDLVKCPSRISYNSFGTSIEVEDMGDYMP